MKFEHLALPCWRSSRRGCAAISSQVWICSAEQGVGLDSQYGIPKRYSPMTQRMKLPCTESAHWSSIVCYAWKELSRFILFYLLPLYPAFFPNEDPKWLPSFFSILCSQQPCVEVKLRGSMRITTWVVASPPPMITMPNWLSDLISMHLRPFNGRWEGLNLGPGILSQQPTFPSSEAWGAPMPKAQRQREEEQSCRRGCSQVPEKWSSPYEIRAAQDSAY